MPTLLAVLSPPPHQTQSYPTYHSWRSLMKNTTLLFMSRILPWLLIVFTFLTTLQHKLNAGCCLRNYFIYSASLRHLHSYYKRGIILVSIDYKRLFLLYLKIKTYNWITGNWKHNINWEKTETERKTEIYKAINTYWKLKTKSWKKTKTMKYILYN